MRTPRPTDHLARFRAETRQRIQRYGFTKLIIGTGECSIPGCDCEPDLHPYAYTLGMHRHDSHEFVTFGLPLSKVSAVVDPVCKMTLDGLPLAVGRDHRFHLSDDLVVSLVDVPDLWVEHDPGRVGAWFDLYEPQFPTFVQIFWGDEQGRMPWEPACNPAVATMQPMLFEDAMSVPPPAMDSRR
ncbi:MAG: DUF4262 domain-containing protein [Actinomycetota bacterium]